MTCAIMYVHVEVVVNCIRPLGKAIMVTGHSKITLKKLSTVAGISKMRGFIFALKNVH